jgi:hypothetical protein
VIDSVSQNRAWYQIGRRDGRRDVLVFLAQLVLLLLAVYGALALGPFLVRLVLL